MTLSAGQRLGPYEIASALGAGAMGEVYRVKDAKLGREVAGLRSSQLYLTHDGRSWMHSCSRLLTDLYLAEGLR